MKIEDLKLLKIIPPQAFYNLHSSIYNLHCLKEYNPTSNNCKANIRDSEPV
ncbi:MAG: hypothetical protein NTW93_02990 [Phycisphaerae bacterium]|nr:hypothetical protein [Phycisphaerae bacterium]